MPSAAAPTPALRPDLIDALLARREHDAGRGDDRPD